MHISVLYFRLSAYVLIKKKRKERFLSCTKHLLSLDTLSTIFGWCPLVMCVDRIQRQEREVMLKLKQVVDKQRDELRSKVQQITTISKEVEAVSRP